MTRLALLPNVRESSRLNGQLKLCSGFFEAELAVLNKLLLLTYQEPFGLRDTFGRRRPAPARERPWAACDNRTMQQEYRGKTYNHDGQRRKPRLFVAIERGGRRRRVAGSAFIESTKTSRAAAPSAGRSNGRSF